MEYETYRGTGTLELRGKAFLSTRTGLVKPAAGRLVTLDPAATSYAKRWFRRYGADPARFDVPGPDPHFAAARKTTTTDADGRFGFSNLPAGSYLLRSTVTWETESADCGVQGGVVAALVSLEQESLYDLLLSRWYPPDSAALLVVHAARRGADAVGGTVCRKRGLSLSANCVSRIECEGDAILFQ